MKTKAKPVKRKPAARTKPRAARKAGPFPSAMSMLNFYINRGRKNLSKERLRILEAAKTDLRAMFGKEP